MARGLGILALGAWLCLPALAAEQTGPSEETEPEMGAEEIVICAPAIPAEGISISTLDRDELLEAGEVVTDALDRLSAIHTSTGGRGERIFSLRGFEQRQTAVLLDGVPLALPYDGQLALDMVPAEWIERISVVKGPSSVVFGPNGLAGAINLRSRSLAGLPRFGLRWETAGVEAQHLAAWHAERYGPLEIGLGGGYERMGGFRLSSSFEPSPNEDGGQRDNSDREFASLIARAGWSPAPGQRLGLVAQLVDGARGVPPSVFDALPRYWRFSTWQAGMISASHTGDLGALQVDELVFARFFANVLDAYDDASYTSQVLPRSFSSRYDDRSLGGRIRARLRLEETPWGLTIVRLWTGLEHDQHRSSRQGQDDEGASLGRLLVSLAPEIELVPIDCLDLRLSLQADVEIPQVDGAGEHWGLNPLLSLGWEAARGLALRATAARRTRFPTLKERFSGMDFLLLPNPALHQESAWHFGLEAAWRPSPELRLEAGCFHAEVDGLIETVPVGDGQQQVQNLDRARLLGAELGASWTPLPWLALDAGYTFLYARRLEPDEPLVYRPAHKAASTLRLRPWKPLELATCLRVVGPVRFVHPETRAMGTLGAYLVWDARLAWQPAAWAELFVRAQNLLDANYMTEYGFPDPGLTVWGGVRLRAS
ncbi:MAG: TonB-dependent receptor [Deltaproteobacteria bacterium]|nr:TonB-dependent receptor [Deltaproteobacteria bacterium]